MNNAIHEAVAPDLVLVHDLDADVAPEATRCPDCLGTGMVQCDRCYLADALCDACGEPAEVIAEFRLPLCALCWATEEGGV